MAYEAIVDDKTNALLKVWRSARKDASHQRRIVKEEWPALYQALNALETADDVRQYQTGQ